MYISLFVCVYMYVSVSVYVHIYVSLCMYVCLFLRSYKDYEEIASGFYEDSEGHPVCF